MLLLTIGCEFEEREKIEPTFVALQLAVHKNVETRMAELLGRYTDRRIITHIYTIPINGEILEAGIAYKASLEGVSGEQVRELHKLATQKYLTGDSAAFALLIHNNFVYDSDDGHV